MVLKPGREAFAEAIFKKWELDFATVGKTTDDLRFRVLWKGEEVANLPIISPHGHTDPEWFATDAPFSNAAELLLQLGQIDPRAIPGIVRRVRRIFDLDADLRIVHATLHESVQHALGRLSPELVADAARAGARALTQLGIQTPRIALMGINPHAGEGGLFGKEDVVITEPAAAQLRAQGFDVTGPAGGDMLLASRSHDLYVAIFHDQGHIPVKVLSPQRASAVSIGADVLLSSVGHGSAMDIAGKGVASARAMIETVAMLGQVTAPPTTEGNAQ